MADPTPREPADDAPTGVAGGVPGRAAARVLRAAAWLLGAGLLAAAVVVVWRQRDAVHGALDAIGDAPAWLVALLPAGAIANLVLSAVFLGLLFRRYGRVGGVEMQAVVAGATLLNYLPLRPGLFGRLAYHRAVNDIALADSARTVIQSVILSAAAAAYLVATALVAPAGGFVPVALLVAPGPVLLGAAAGLRGRRSAWFVLAALVRYVELLVWAARYAVAFALVGAPIGLAPALAFAAVSVLAGLVPLVSNGLGLREWTIGLLAPVLTAHHLEIAVTADLANRAAEMLIALAAGIPALLWLARRAVDAGPRSEPATADRAGDA